MGERIPDEAVVAAAKRSQELASKLRFLSDDQTWFQLAEGYECDVAALLHQAASQIESDQHLRAVVEGLVARIEAEAVLADGEVASREIEGEIAYSEGVAVGLRHSAELVAAALKQAKEALG